MATKLKVVYRKAKRKRGRKGFRFPKLFDISQGSYNARELGYFEAGGQLMDGDLEGAGNTIADAASSLGTMLNLSVGNVVIGFNRKIVRWTGGAFVRRYIA